MKHKIIIDCDPGHDDSLAILLAARHPQIELLAITTVAGNQSVEKTTRNALKVCTLANIRNVPIARGMDRPLVRPAKHAPDIHGESGLDGPHIPTGYRAGTPARSRTADRTAPEFGWRYYACSYRPFDKYRGRYAPRACHSTQNCRYFADGRCHRPGQCHACCRV